MAAVFKYLLPANVKQVSLLNSGHMTWTEQFSNPALSLEINLILLQSTILAIFSKMDKIR